MADAGTTGLQGVAELTRKLRELGALEDGRAIRRAVYAGMKPALVAARNRIPVGTQAHRSYKGNILQPGFAKRSLRIVTTLSPDKQKAVALLGPRKEGYYATQFVERGTSKMAAKPWLRPAFYSTATAQRQGISDSLNATINKIAKSGH